MTNRPSQTTNRFHFSDLDPLRFEDISYQLLQATYQWIELIHLGRSGADGGIDIKGRQMVGDRRELWLIQCKRYKNLTNNDLIAMVDKLLLNGDKPDKVLLVISCDISASKYEAINTYCSKLGIPELIIWTASTLEAFLYAHPRIKAIAFGEDPQKEETKKNTERIKHGLKMEKRVLKALINHKFINDRANWDTLMKYPSSRFISDEFYIRDINDRSYPESPMKEKGKISPWFRSFIYNTYHHGLEFWLSPAIGTDVIMNAKGLWEPIMNSDDPRLKDPQYKVIPVKAIGRIPYYGIVDFSIDGDNINPCPHLFCLFDKEDNMPYDEIYYRHHGSEKTGYIDWELDKSKRVEFSKNGSQSTAL